MHALERLKNFAQLGNHDDHPWKPMPWDGIFNKVLFCDPVIGTTIELAKIEKGAIFPVHYHPCMQTLFLLRGQLSLDGRTILPGTFDVIPAGERHAGYVAEEESVQYKLFSSIPIYFMDGGDVFYYQYDGTVQKFDVNTSPAQNIMIP
jgi:hypothetical protein